MTPFLYYNICALRTSINFVEVDVNFRTIYSNTNSSVRTLFFLHIPLVIYQVTHALIIVYKYICGRTD